MTAASWEKIRRLVCSLQDHVLAVIRTAQSARSRNFAGVAAVTAADTIYEVDRISEAAIGDWFAAHWPAAWPVEVVLEGEEAERTFPRGTPVARTRFKCILDPIDGTRGLMYDKRSAWTLAGVAPQRGRRTGLTDIVVAVMTELPTTKQWRADRISAVRGRGARGVTAESIDWRRGRRMPLVLRRSRAADCRGGFASVVKYFPEGKALLAQFEEALWRGLYGTGTSQVFDDQYLATSGQLYELLSGRDRMIADLRPLAYRKLGLGSALCCHPYDICTALILQESGGLVEAPDGRPLRAPLDTLSPVAWVGYANPAIARHVRPELRRLLKKFF